MASLNSDLGPKLFLGLLNGLGKRIFLGDEITDEFLNERVFASSSLGEEAVAALIADLSRLLRRAAHQSWSASDLEAALAKSGGGVDAEHTAVLLAFWRKEGGKYHEALCRRSLFTNNTLDRVTWRVDVKAQASTATKSDAGREGGEGGAQGVGGEDPQSDVAAIVEMRLRDGAAGDESAGTETVQFEIDREQLADLVAQLGAVKAAIARRTGAA